MLTWTRCIIRNNIDKLELIKMRKQRIWNKAHHHLCTTFLPPTYQSATILVKKTAKSRTQIEQTKQIKID